jgi:hypothetical protein
MVFIRTNSSSFSSQRFEGPLLSQSRVLGITAFTYFKYSAHHPGRKSGTVITYELVDLAKADFQFPSLTEKMLIAFFNISRSIFASLSSLRKRAFSRSKSVIFGVP